MTNKKHLHLISNIALAQWCPIFGVVVEYTRLDIVLDISKHEVCLTKQPDFVESHETCFTDRY